MRLTYLAYSFSLTIMYFSFVLLLPVLVALYFHETNAILPFLLTGAFALMISVTIRKLVSGAAKIKSINDIKKSEGLCVVTFSWLFAAILAAIPYTFFGIKPVDAFFEAMSGITATGATVFTHFNYPNALFFWRSFTQWLGGMDYFTYFCRQLTAGRRLLHGPHSDPPPRLRTHNDEDCS